MDEKCGFFRWLPEYRKVVASRDHKGKNLIRGEIAGMLIEGPTEVNVKPKIFSDDKMEKLLCLVQFLVVTCIVIAILVFLGIVVILVK